MFSVSLVSPGSLSQLESSVGWNARGASLCQRGQCGHTARCGASELVGQCCLPQRPLHVPIRLMSEGFFRTLSKRWAPCKAAKALPARSITREFPNLSYSYCSYLFIHSTNILLRVYHVSGTIPYLGNTVDGLSLDSSSLAPECFWNRRTYQDPRQVLTQVY